MVVPDAILLIESYAASGNGFDDARVQDMLGLEHALRQIVRGVTGTDGYCRLRDDRTFVVPLVDEVNGWTR